MSGDLDLSVDRASEIPVGTQLIWKLRTLITTGLLEPRAQLPGIRELAELADVNVNTVRSVLARLEEQGLLVTEHGRGTFVTQSARLDASLAETADAARTQAHAAGIDPRELAAALYATASRLPSQAKAFDARAENPEAPTRTSHGRAERRELYAQIEQLERAYEKLGELGTLERPATSTGPRILTLAELRQTRDDLANRIDQLHQERERQRAEDLAAAAQLEAEEPRSSRQWRHAGISTGWPTAKISWTAP